MKFVLVAGLALCLAAVAGCAADQPVGPPTPTSAAPTPPSAPPPQPTADQCGAAEAQKYVGRPRTEIPVPVNPDVQRVACTTCPITLEFMPKRLNFFYDAATDVVKEVKCG